MTGSDGSALHETVAFSGRTRSSTSSSTSWPRRPPVVVTRTA